MTTSRRRGAARLVVASGRVSPSAVTYEIHRADISRLCRLSCIILFLIQLRHFCHFRRVEAASIHPADIRDRIAFDVRRFDIQCVEYSFPRKRNVGCSRCLPADCLRCSGIVICFYIFRDRGYNSVPIAICNNNTSDYDVDTEQKLKKSSKIHYILIFLIVFPFLEF